MTTASPLEPSDRPRVVLLHSSASSHKQWRNLRALLNADYDVFAPDQWGCGTAPAWPGTSPFTLMDEVRPLAERIGPAGDRIHLIGHSYGAGVALRLARTWPERVASLTLIEPTAFHVLRHSADDRPLFRQVTEVAGRISRAVISGHYDQGMREFVDYWNGHGAWDRMPEDRRAQLLPRLAKVPLDFRALFQDESQAADFRSVKAPTLIIQGAESRLQVARICDLLCGGLHVTDRIALAGAGHMVPITHAPQVNAIVRGFLRRQTRPLYRAA